MTATTRPMAQTQGKPFLKASPRISSLEKKPASGGMPPIAIAGIPPLAGFFSKDEILGEAFKNGFPWVWAIGLVVAVMTAFYMWRLMGKTFYGEPSAHVKRIWDRIHESTWTMTVPLV